MPDHIAIYRGRLSAGGANRSLIHISKYLSDNGYEVDFVVANSSGEFSDKIPEKVSLIDCKADRQLSAIPKITKYLRQIEPDAILSTAHSSIVTSILSTYLSMSNTKIIARQGTVLSEHYKHQGGNKAKIVYQMTKSLLPRSDTIIAISQGVKRDLIEQTSLESSDIEVIYNPAIPSVKKVEKKASKKTDHPWLNKKDQPVILGTGRLAPQKDFPTLLRAFKIINAHRDCRLIILGDGSEKENLIKMSKDLGIHEKVSFPGYSDNPYSYMASSDVFVMSSAWEGFGIVLVEAMACGTPVVSTDCESGPSEILNGGQYGPLVEVGDYTELADKIGSLLDNPTDSSLLKSRAEDFTLDNVKQYDQVIKETIHDV